LLVCLLFICLTRSLIHMWTPIVFERSVPTRYVRSHSLASLSLLFLFLRLSPTSFFHSSNRITLYNTINVTPLTTEFSCV
jgi:hypothetical protein